MPIIVNQNTHQSLKLVTGTSYKALDIIFNKTYPGHRVNADTILYFKPLARILPALKTTKDFHFVRMPHGTVLLAPISIRIKCQKKQPWQQSNVSRRELSYVAAFAYTDYKVQGKTLDRAVLELRKTRTTIIDSQAVPTQCNPSNLYMQLSQCPSLNGISLLSKARERDFIGNKVPDNMIAAEERLELLSEATIRDAESWDWIEDGRIMEGD